MIIQETSFVRISNRIQEDLDRIVEEITQLEGIVEAGLGLSTITTS
jgi:hypothetical protein